MKKINVENVNNSLIIGFKFKGKNVPERLSKKGYIAIVGGDYSGNYFFQALSNDYPVSGTVPNRAFGRDFKYSVREAAAYIVNVYGEFKPQFYQFTSQSELHKWLAKG